jgi:Ca2+/Na+ antiporter
MTSLPNSKPAAGSTWAPQLQLFLTREHYLLTRKDLHDASVTQSDDIRNARAAVQRQSDAGRMQYILAERTRNSDRYWATACRLAAVLVAGIAAALALWTDGRVPRWIAMSIVTLLVVMLLVGIMVAAKSNQSRDRLFWNRRYWNVKADADKGTQASQVVPPSHHDDKITTFCCDRKTARKGMLYTVYSGHKVSDPLAVVKKQNQVPTKGCLLTRPLSGPFSTTFGEDNNEESVLWFRDAGGSYTYRVCTMDLRGAFVPEHTGDHQITVACGGMMYAFLWITTPSSSSASTPEDITQAQIKIPTLQAQPSTKTTTISCVASKQLTLRLLYCNTSSELGGSHLTATVRDPVGDTKNLVTYCVTVLT